LKFHLTRHQRTHSGEKHYQWNVCGWALKLVHACVPQRTHPSEWEELVYSNSVPLILCPLGLQWWETVSAMYVGRPGSCQAGSLIWEVIQVTDLYN
jgi:hypothetical protein